MFWGEGRMKGKDGFGGGGGGRGRAGEHDMNKIWILVWGEGVGNEMKRINAGLGMKGKE